MGFRADTPDVEIVNVVDAFDSADRRLNFLQLHATRGTFEQNVQRLADDAESGPQNKHADADRKNRVDPVISGEQDRPALSELTFFSGR